MPFRSFNLSLDSAYKNGYTATPVDIALDYVKLKDEKSNCNIQVNKLDGSNIEVVIKHDFNDDDSVRGDYFRICLNDKSGKWYITSAEIAWKCWDDRGHSNYSNVPCE